jgi:S1-C subfamily serine protease
VAVTTGVVGDLLMPAFGTPQNVTPKGSGAAGEEVLQHALLVGRQPPEHLAVLRAPSLGVAPYRFLADTSRVRVSAADLTPSTD